MKINGLRHELRKTLSDSDLAWLRQLVAEGGWEARQPRRVHSLIYENARNQRLDKKRKWNREKFTIEYYNEDADNISLVKKSRRKDCYLQRVSPVSRHECEKILSGDMEVLHGETDPLIFEFYNRIEMGDLREWMLADYTIETFFSPDGKVQVSVESDFQTGLNTNDFLNEWHPVTKRTGPVILEVKYDKTLPEMISRFAGSERKAEAFAFASALPAL
jgi:hypothetical protein